MSTVSLVTFVRMAKLVDMDYLVDSQFPVSLPLLPPILTHTDLDWLTRRYASTRNERT